jgi:hypothetical protein
VDGNFLYGVVQFRPKAVVMAFFHKFDDFFRLEEWEIYVGVQVVAVVDVDYIRPAL